MEVGDEVKYVGGQDCMKASLFLLIYLPKGNIGYYIQGGRTKNEMTSYTAKENTIVKPQMMCVNPMRSTVIQVLLYQESGVWGMVGSMACVLIRKW